MKTFRTVRVQPRLSPWAFRNEWATGLCGCCGDMRTCTRYDWFDRRKNILFVCFVLLCLGCTACFCAPCFLTNLHARTNECPCMWCFPGGK